MHLLYFSFLQSLLLKYAKLLQTPVLLRHDIQIAAASLFDILRKKASATLTYKKLRVWYECNLCNMMPCCFGSCQTLKDAKCCYCVEIEIIFGSNKRISNIGAFQHSFYSLSFIWPSSISCLLNLQVLSNSTFNLDELYSLKCSFPTMSLNVIILKTNIYSANSIPRIVFSTKL